MGFDRHHELQQTVLRHDDHDECKRDKEAYHWGLGHPAGVGKAVPMGEGLFELGDDGLSVSVSVAGSGFLSVVVVDVRVGSGADVDVHVWGGLWFWLCGGEHAVDLLGGCGWRGEARAGKHAALLPFGDEDVLEDKNNVFR